MPIIIEVNVQTGERTEREMTPEEVAALPEPDPQVEQPALDPVEKLRAFLGANPDVSDLIART